MPLESNAVIINGRRFKLISDSSLPRGKRAWSYGLRPTQPADPAEQRSVRWQLWGPNGRSRSDDPTQLRTDWSELETRFEQLLLPPPKRNQVTLSASSSPIDHDPDADVTTTSWTSTGANFFSVTDDYDSPNDADYGSTATEDAYLVMGLPTVTDPQVDTGHIMRARVVNPAGQAVTIGYKLRLYEGTTVVATSEEFTVEQVGVSILDTFVTGRDTLPTITTPSAGTNRVAVLLVSTDSDDDTVNQLTAMTVGGQSMTKHSLEASDVVGVGETRVSAWTLNDAGITSMSGVAFSPTWTTGTAPADGIYYTWFVVENANQTTPISDSDEDEGANTVITDLTVGAGDMVVNAVVNAYWISGQSFTQPNGYTEVFQDFIGPGPDPGSYHTVSYKLFAEAVAAEAPWTAFSLPNEDRASGLAIVIQSASATADAAQNTEWTVPSGSIATISSYADLRVGIAKTSPADANSLRLSAIELEVPQVAVQDVTHLQVDRGQIFAGRGTSMVQVNPLDMTEVEDVTMPATIKTMGLWQGAGFVGYGANAPIDKRGAVSAGGEGDVYTAITGVNANAMGASQERFWIATDANLYQFAVDDITASGDFGPVVPLQIHDPGITATGIYTVGPHTVAANEAGAHTFTPVGGSQTLVRTLAESSDNGRAGFTLDRWVYIATETGLRATNVDNLITNVVGPGEGPEGYAFEGDVTGIPTAAMEFRGDAIVAYYDKDTDCSWLLRGVFNPNFTPDTGALDWFTIQGPIENTRIRALGVTAERTLPAIIAAEDSNLTYYSQGRGGRDIRDSEYDYEDDGVARSWYGTTLMTQAGTHKNARYFVLFVKNVSDTDYWQLSLSTDDGAYVDIDDPMTSSGHKFLRPSTNDVPLTSVNGHHFKPKLTLVNTQSRTPPQLIGYLDMVYDERPDTVEEHRMIVQLGDIADEVDELADLKNLLLLHRQPSPISVELPTQNSLVYAHVTAINEITDFQGDQNRAAEIVFQLWDV